MADRVKKIIVETLGVTADRVTKEAGFIDDLKALRQDHFGGLDD
ncbi:acyl carrier protein [Mesorhizobium sp. LNHC220B00]|nr:acyl carrier protein [Mesorhizobium sp. LNHC220B00]